MQNWQRFRIGLMLLHHVPYENLLCQITFFKKPNWQNGWYWKGGKTDGGLLFGFWDWHNHFPEIRNIWYKNGGYCFFSNITKLMNILFSPFHIGNHDVLDCRSFCKNILHMLALSHKAELLIMDEPTSGLDPLVRGQLLNILKDYMGDKSRDTAVRQIKGDVF